MEVYAAQIDRIDAPVLLVHGAHDTNVVPLPGATGSKP